MYLDLIKIDLKLVFQDSKVELLRILNGKNLQPSCTQKCRKKRKYREKFTKHSINKQ